MSANQFIKVYHFNDAPHELRMMSENGGDEDWIAIVPKCLKDDYISWLEEGSPFGCCCVETHELEDGSVLYIGCHS